jgi:hypothetical protein
MEDGMAQKPKKTDPQATIKQIRLLLTSWLHAHPDSSSVVGEILRLVEHLDGLVPPAKASMRPRSSNARYTVQPTEESSFMLHEWRSGDKLSPLKVPRKIYEVVAQIFDANTAALELSEVLEFARKKHTFPVKQIDVQACVDFWLWHCPKRVTVGMFKRPITLYQPPTKPGSTSLPNHIDGYLSKRINDER